MMKQALLIGAVALVALGLLGCAAQSPTPAGKKSFGVLKLGTASKVMGHAPIYIAERKGYFQEEGFDSVEINFFNTGTLNQAGVQSGEVQFSSGAFSGVMDATKGGKAELAIMAITSQQTDGLVMRKETADRKGVTPSTPLDQKIRAMKGLKIGITAAGAGTDELSRFMLKNAGMDPDRDVELVPIGGQDALVAAVSQGSVDVALINSPSLEVPMLQGKAIPLIISAKGEYPPLDGMLYLSLFGMKDYIEGNPELTQAVINALMKAVKLIVDRPDEAKAVLREFFSDVDEQRFNLAWENVRPAYTRPEITKEGVEKVFQVGKAVWGRDAPFGWDTVATNRFVEEAKRQLGMR